MGEAFDLKNSPCPGLPTQNTEEADVVVGTPPIPGRARTNLLRHSRSYLCPRIEPLASENLRPPAHSGTLQSRSHLRSGISRKRGTTPTEPFARDSWLFPSFSFSGSSVSIPALLTVPKMEMKFSVFMMRLRIFGFERTSR